MVRVSASGTSAHTRLIYEGCGFYEQAKRVNPSRATGVASKRIAKVVKKAGEQQAQAGSVIGPARPY